MLYVNFSCLFARIPCDPQDNSVYDESHRKCGMQPGCYFDKPLYELRKAFGPSVLPGVPVCHLAIRNKVFQNKAKAVVDAVNIKYVAFLHIGLL